jgi:hypothetical protein
LIPIPEHDWTALRIILNLPIPEEDWLSLNVEAGKLSNVIIPIPHNDWQAVNTTLEEVI